MSFCTDVKNELVGLRLPKYCKPSLAYGFLLFSRSFSLKNICMQTNNLAVAEYYSRLLREVWGVGTILNTGGEKKPTYRVSVPNEAERLKILASVDFGMSETPINPEAEADEASAAAFVRGAFLACGALSNPEKEYRADFSVKSEALAEELSAFLSRHFISAHISKRGTGFCVYIKQSEMITNLLTLIGASDKSLQVIETTILKSVKNNINRAGNCDSANISRTVEASIAQREAIAYFEERGRLSNLPEELQTAARLRKDNPNASLKELCRISDEPITVSGLNHRLRRIIALYTEETKK